MKTYEELLVWRGLANNATLEASKWKARAEALEKALECIKQYGHLEHREDALEVCYEWCPKCALDAALSQHSGERRKLDDRDSERTTGDYAFDKVGAPAHTHFDRPVLFGICLRCRQASRIACGTLPTCSPPSIFAIMANPTEDHFHSLVSQASGFAMKGLPDFAVFDHQWRFLGVVEVKPDQGRRSLRIEQERTLRGLAAYGVPCFVWSPRKGLQKIATDGSLTPASLERLFDSTQI